MSAALILRSTDSEAEIESVGFRCASLVIRGRQVLGAVGMGVEFPWVGAQPARPARLMLRDQAVAIGGGRVSLTWRMTGLATAETRTMPGDGYPFAVRLDATWLLDDEGLRLTLAVVNESRAHAPEEVWPASGDGPPVPVRGDLDLRRPRPLAQPIKARFTRRHFANLQTQLAVLSRGREVWLTTSADFREADMRIQPDGSGVLESATCVPDAFARHAAGVATGLRVLAPGEVWRGHALLVTR